MKSFSRSVYMLICICLVVVINFTGCASNKTTITPKDSYSEKDAKKADEGITIKQSPDKYTWYIKNYVGKNCASLGYTSIGGDRCDSYGAGLLKLVFVNSNGSYIDITSDDALKEYSVIGQNISPNAELKLVFDKDSEGNEYDNLVASQSFEEIVLSVKKVGDKKQDPVKLTSINPSTDKYTWYIADYVGRNLVDCGYTSIGGDLLVKYGAAVVKIIIVAEDGAYIDPTDKELLKNYVVTNQNISPNTELKLVFDKDSEGVEYDNLVESQNIEEIELFVKAVKSNN